MSCETKAEIRGSLKNACKTRTWLTFFALFHGIPGLLRPDGLMDPISVQNDVNSQRTLETSINKYVFRYDCNIS
ncbi:hypothetical protein F01_500154 [Burkholderia cenocepacia]|nr:hypothetical protein F01_500154 [Burkholderia cenocepacia]